MAKFSTFKKKIRSQRTLFDLPLLLTLDGEEGTERRSIPVALVGLDGEGDTKVLRAARAFAKEGGVENPKPGEPLYERGLWYYTVLHTVMDADVTDKDEPFFASIDEILKHCDPDRISLLFHAQRAWQAKIAPDQGTMTDGEYIRHIVELAYAAEEEDRDGEMKSIPFDSLPFGTQLRFLRRLARQFSTWIATNSPSGSATGTDSSTRSSSENSTAQETSDPTAKSSGEAAGEGETPVPDDAPAPEGGT
jgi:hypothetical protein